MNRILIFVAIVLAVLMASCNKEEDPSTQIIVGKKTGNAISSNFEPIVIEREYGGHNESINFSEQPYLLISNYFNISHGDYQEHWVKQIKTLDNCLLKTNGLALAVFKSGDVVTIDSEFKANSFDLPALSNDNYLVFKFESDKKYIGWIKISNSGYNIIVSDYCLYETK